MFLILGVQLPLKGYSFKSSVKFVVSEILLKCKKIKMTLTTFYLIKQKFYFMIWYVCQWNDDSIKQSSLILLFSGLRQISFLMLIDDTKWIIDSLTFCLSTFSTWENWYQWWNLCLKFSQSLFWWKSVKLYLWRNTKIGSSKWYYELKDKLQVLLFCIKNF